MTAEPRRHSVSTLRVRYGETDQMGVAYHANYLVWCEIGRTDFMRERGIPYAALERDGIFLAVVDAAVRYHAAAEYDEEVRVLSRIERVQSRTVTFAYEIRGIGERDRRIATASTTLMALDDGGRPRTLPPSVLHALRGAPA